jgi:hypothetical protein
VSWNPAVPPPPVAGAAAGNGLAEWLGDADGLGVADAVAEGVSLALGVVVLAEPLAGVAEPDTAGENGVGVGEGEDPEQAETDAEATMAKVAKQAAVNLELRPVPMMVVRIVTGPPYAAGGRRAVFPVPGIGREIVAGWSLPAPSRRQIPWSAGGQEGKAVDGTLMKWPGHHWNIRLRD